jgi:hypothetical protein
MQYWSKMLNSVAIACACRRSTKVLSMAQESEMATDKLRSLDFERSEEAGECSTTSLKFSTRLGDHLIGFFFFQIREWHFFEKEFIKWYNLTLLYFKNTIYKYQENFNWCYDFKTRYLFKCYGCETWHNILIFFNENIIF